MEILDKGHKYKLLNNKTNYHHTNTLTFYKDPKINGDGYHGTTNQEVLRALIDRVKFLDSQVPCTINDSIIEHLRMALILHEERHLHRLVERGDAVESIETQMTGHFV